MDFSDLPQSAQDRIAAAEIEAKSILKHSKIPAKVARIRAGIPWAKPEAWRDGRIQEQKRFEQGLFEAAARDSLHQGRIRAVRHLLGTATGEYIREGNLDNEQLDAKLEAIGDWVCKKFRVKRAWFNAEKQGWRVMALRKRAAAGSFLQVKQGGETAPSTERPAVNGKSNSGTDRRAATDRFILKCKVETSRKITRTHIWRAAEHGSPRQFQYWQASDPKATAEDDQNFRRILAMNPTDFEALLKKKGIT